MSRLPRLPLTAFERAGSGDTRFWPATTWPTATWLQTDSSARTKLFTNTMPSPFPVIRETSALTDALRPVPNFTEGGWAWVYNSVFTIRQGVKANTDANTLQAKLALNWTGPYKVLAIGPCFSADTTDGSPLGDNLLYLDIPSELPGSNARRRVAIKRCKPCGNPHDSNDRPKYLQVGLTQYVLNNDSKKSTPCHVT